MAPTSEARSRNGKSIKPSTPKILTKMINPQKATAHKPMSKSRNSQSLTTVGISAKRQLKKYAVPKGAAQTSKTSRSRVMRKYSRLLDRSEEHTSELQS